MANEQLSNSQILIKECVAQEYAEAASFENEAVVLCQDLVQVKMRFSPS